MVNRIVTITTRPPVIIYASNTSKTTAKYQLSSMTRSQIISDEDNVGVSSVASILPQRDRYPSGSECSDPSSLTTVSTMIEREVGDDLCRGESGCQKKRTRSSSSFRSGVSLSPYLAIIFLLAAKQSVVLAQVQNENNGSTIAPTVPLTPAGVDPVPPETTGTIPTTAPAPVAPPILATTVPVPTATPTRNPTLQPTLHPTTSTKPSVSASGAPSFSPTLSSAPTTPEPSAQPTMEKPMLKETKFRQEFQVGNSREFNDDELSLFQTLYQRYTVDFAPIPESEVESKITTVCTVDKQTFLFSARHRQLQNDNGWVSYLRRRLRRLDQEVILEETDTLNVDYTMSYESRHYNVTEYPKLFQNWTTNNLNVVLEQMQFLNFDVVSVDVPKRIVVSTPAPTISMEPSESPTMEPTSTLRPTVSSVTAAPALTAGPTPIDPEQGFGSFNIIIIAVSLTIAITIIVIGVFLYYRKRNTNREDTYGVNGSKRTSQARGSEVHGMRWTDSGQHPSYNTSETKAYGSSYGRHSDVPSRLADAVSSPPGSLVSSQSLISRGNSMGGDSRDEEDAAHTLVDEFDQYKDQNLEKMRAEIEGLPECDGMMSQAVAKALIDQDDDAFMSINYWGGDQDISPEEIEASALGFVLDWLKRNGKVSDREK